MSIVTFDLIGNLHPYTIIPLSLEECENIFVSNLNDLQVRKQRWKEFNNYNSDLKLNLKNKLTQWIDGSFTTTKEIPSDIDVVSFIAYEDMSEFLVIFDMNFSKTKTKKVYNIDGYIVFNVSESSEYYDRMIKRVEYWKKWFGKDRIRNPKGLIEIQHD